MLRNRETGPTRGPQAGNRLIAGLPGRLRSSVLKQCEPVELESGQVLCEAGEPFTFAYFPVTGTISLVRELPGHEPFETVSIGSEGMLGAPLILGVNRAYQRGIVQTPCLALRMGAGALQTALHDHVELSRVLQRYLYVVLEELSQSKGCIRFHDVGKRLSRCLLLAQDRARTDTLAMTHQMLADILGVQRGAVTNAAIKLQREGILRYSRGKITIVDRERLEASSCSCYGASIANHARVLS